ncbi:D-lyxose/D-mannose family sugar isomerase [Plastorhodobacter daqingensis]|uniref:D-lyxose ketol-isomerase n=1 Tax=Plastorhodobacter daqingensis TaxID=1387281 RepID=A0ABW2UKQ5_9RHOB
MKRSEINAALRRAEAMLSHYRWHLPDWAAWDPADHGREPALAAHLRDRQLGWDVTDFGLGDFARNGLTLFCVRNGRQGDPATLPYAEKLLFIAEDQVTPFHAHKVKLEDIIVRGGGNLMVAFTREGSFDDAPVLVDGRTVSDPYAGPIRLGPGQSITIPRGMQHSFWGEAGAGDVFVAEVSQCNDDLTDNYFRDRIGRFSEIEEDEAPHRLLWNET